MTTTLTFAIYIIAFGLVLFIVLAAWDIAEDAHANWRDMRRGK